MRTLARPLLLPGLLVGVLGVSASAQDLTAYGKLAANLDGAVTARATSAQAALSRLDAAQVALDQLGPSLRNRQIVSGLQNTLSSARAALARTPAELEAQVLLARGLMRKALYDQTLTVLSGNPKNGAAQLRVLSREFGLSTAAAQDVAADARAGKLERVAWRLQRTAAQKLSTALEVTRAVQSTTSYLNLARATSWFTVVQDATGSSGLKATQFSEALTQLTSGDTANLSQSLAALQRGARALQQSLAAPPTGATPSNGANDQVPVVVTSDPVTPVTPTVAAPPAGSVGVTPTPTSPTSTTSTSSASLSGGSGAVYAHLGRALTATGHAANVQARDHLREANAALASLPGAVVGAAGYNDFVFNLKAAQGRSALRPSDVQALIAQLANVEAAALGQPTSGLDRVSAVVGRAMSGWVRVTLFTLLALLSVVPLYLLNLAFGGRNPYWRAIAAGLALLLLPLFLEGLLGLLGALGDATNVPALRSLTNFTLTQGGYALPVWALLSAAAIGLTAYGFRGLCQQFGLLGHTSVPATPKNPTQQNLDWDEDL